VVVGLCGVSGRRPRTDRETHGPNLVDSDDWQNAHLLTGDAAKRNWLLDDELRCAQIALADFYVARLAVKRRAGREAWERLRVPLVMRIARAA
jgi:hypothetical protein